MFDLAKSFSGVLQATTLFLLLSLGVVAPSVGDVKAPVPLRTPPLLVPSQTAGTGMAPEAKVRIHLDTRGVVTQVEVLSIAPSSEFDDLFRTEIHDTLSQWRYAPQTRDGVPEPTQLEWIVRFPSRQAANNEPDPTDSELPGASAEMQRSRILSLPPEQFAALLNAQAAAASRLLDPQYSKRASTDRFVVHTDAKDPTVATAIGNNLESIFNVLAHELLPGIQLESSAFKTQVFVYSSQQSYLSLISEMPQYEWSAGFYSPAGIIAFHLQQPTDDAVLSLMLHEATHAFLDRHVTRKGIALPRWLGEGFADYVGNSEIKKGRLLPGNMRSRVLEMRLDGIANVGTAGASMLDEVKRSLRKGRGLGVPELLEAPREIFYGEHRRLFYDSAWLLVHYLREGQESWDTDQFPQLLLYLAEGYPPEAAFRWIYGDLETADQQFREYVKRF